MTTVTFLGGVVLVDQDDRAGKRLELAFLRDTQEWLMAGGVLIYLVPQNRITPHVAARLAKGKKGESIGNRLRKALKLEAAKRALLQEVARPLPEDAGALAALLKALPVPLQGPMAMDSAISTAGGLRFGALDAGLMLRERPGVFAAGEMLDWEAPTGGYLLTACLATGRWAGLHAARWAKARRTRAQGE